MHKSIRSRLFEGQILHYVALAALLILVSRCLETPGGQSGRFLGLSSTQWVWLAALNAITHHVYVWFCWRVELHGGWLSRRFGNHAFRIFATGFLILFVLRPILAFSLGWANRGTLPLASLFSYTLAGICFGFAAYTMYSVRTYFSFDRAFGIDHFDDAYRTLPLERRGVFRLSPNAMYVFGFLTLWIPAFLFQSTAALIMAGFSHAYIWVHYFATERPDMRHIYGD